MGLPQPVVAISGDCLPAGEIGYMLRGMRSEPEGQLEPIKGSALPLVTSDSQPPLVIDLPDGQKLVVGNLQPGTVIEVATWRGTGRPDSRTNRLMLGVSSPDEEVGIHNDDPKPQLPQGSMKEKVAISESLNGSASSTIPSVKAVDPPRERSVPIMEKINRKFVIKFSASVLVIFLIFAGLIGPAGLRLAHPNSGLSSSLGSAKDSLVVVRQDTGGKVGEPVLANIQDAEQSPILAVVATMDGANYLLQTNYGYFQTTLDKLHGKVIFVIPFAGRLATLFGK